MPSRCQDLMQDEVIALGSYFVWERVSKIDEKRTGSQMAHQSPYWCTLEDYISLVAPSPALQYPRGIHTIHARMPCESLEVETLDTVTDKDPGPG